MITPNGRHLGRRRDEADPRDHRFAVAHANAMAAPLPPSTDLTDALPACFDQSALGSCGANAGAGLLADLFPGFVASRLQIYFDARELEGTTSTDSGVQTRDVLKTLQQIGAIPEAEWPYDITKFTMRPPVDAVGRKLGSYSRLASEDEFLACLASGNTFLLGFEVPSYFDDDTMAAHGVFWLPGDARPPIMGGHDVLIVGHDLHFKSNPDFLASGVDAASVQDEALLVRNSWSTEWGLPSKPGHFWMPMSWASNPSTGGDAWTGRRAT